MYFYIYLLSPLTVTLCVWVTTTQWFTTYTLLVWRYLLFPICRASRAGHTRSCTVGAVMPAIFSCCLLWNTSSYCFFCSWWSFSSMNGHEWPARMSLLRLWLFLIHNDHSVIIPYIIKTVKCVYQMIDMLHDALFPTINAEIHTYWNKSTSTWNMC